MCESAAGQHWRTCHAPKPQLEPMHWPDGPPGALELCYSFVNAPRPVLLLCLRAHRMALTSTKEYAIIDGCRAFSAFSFVGFDKHGLKALL